MVTDPSKPFMANAIVNRMWAHYVGVGFTKPIDDMGPHNPPCHPELASYLATEFQKAGYDLKRLTRWICASETYNLTSREHADNKADDPAIGAPPCSVRCTSSRSRPNNSTIR